MFCVKSSLKQRSQHVPGQNTERVAAWKCVPFIQNVLDAQWIINKCDVCAWLCMQLRVGPHATGYGGVSVCSVYKELSPVAKAK